VATPLFPPYINTDAFQIYYDMDPAINALHGEDVYWGPVEVIQV
jgi:hypothetical protein